MNAIVRDSNKWQEVLRRIEHQAEGHQDATISSNRLKYIGNKQIMLPTALDAGYKTVALNKHSFAQMCDLIDVPTGYAHTLSEKNPTLANEIINDGLQRHNDKLFWRFSEDRVRAVSSDKVVPIDNNAVVSAMDKYISSEQNDFVIRSVSLDDDRFYLKVLFDEEYRDRTGLTRGNHLKVGIMTRTTETNNGAIMVKPFIYRWSCTNDAIVARSNSFEAFSHSVTHAQLTEGVSSVVAYARLEAKTLVDRMLESQSEIVKNPKVVLQQIASDLSLNKSDTKRLIYAYNKEPMPTRYGVVQALTLFAQSVELDARARIETRAGELSETWAY